MKTKYRVILAVEIDGRTYEFGQLVELDLEQAKEYSHALIAYHEPKEEADGGNK